MYRFRPLFVLHSAVVALLLVASVAVPQPTSQAVVADEAPQVLLSISKGDREDTLTCRAKNVPLESLLRVLSRVAHINIVVGQDVQDHNVLNVDVRDTPTGPLMDLLAKAQDLVIRREDNVWFVSAAAAPQHVECMMLVLDVATDELDAVFAAHPGQQEQFRLPRGVALLLGQSRDGVSGILTSVGTTVVNEPHVITTDGHEAEVSFATRQDPAPDINFPDAHAHDVAQVLWLRPRVQDQDHVSLALAVSVAWPASDRPHHRSAGPEGDYSFRISLPEVTLARGQWLLVRGCDLGSGGSTAAGRETAWIVTASTVLPKP